MCRRRLKRLYFLFNVKSGPTGPTRLETSKITVYCKLKQLFFFATTVGQVVPRVAKNTGQPQPTMPNC